MLLDTINSPADLRPLTERQLDTLAGEIREFIVDAVARNGGHLGSNLGAVELTLALHRVFDSPATSSCGTPATRPTSTRCVTGRRDDFDTLRQAGRPVGLPVPGRVRARLDREQPRLHDPQLRPRPRRRRRSQRAVGDASRRRRRASSATAR